MVTKYREVKRGELQLTSVVDVADLETFALRARKLGVTAVQFDAQKQELSFTQPVDTGTVAEPRA